MRKTSLAILGFQCFLGTQTWAMSPGEALLNKPGSDSLTRFMTAVEDTFDEPSIQRFSNNPLHSLIAGERIAGTEIETTKFRHYFKGVEVFGSSAFHHQGKWTTRIRNGLKNFELDVTPRLTVDEAIFLAKSYAGDRALLSAPTLKIFPDENQDSARLIYWVEMDETDGQAARDLLFDAQSGELLANLSKHIEIAPIEVFSAEKQGVALELKMEKLFFGFLGSRMTGCTVKDLGTGKTKEVDKATCDELISKECQIVVDGDPIVITPRACTRVAQDGKASDKADTSAKRALLNATKGAEYFLNEHGRDSYDGKGGTLTSVVHAGIGYANAHWDLKNKRMVYGDGDGKVLGDFTLALDVAGHELTHGVASQTSKLLNMGESGALGEAYSDFFGKMIEGENDWVVGRKLFLGDNSKQGIRDLAKPENLKFRGLKRPYPSHIKDKESTSGRCDQDNDACWVHFNATIPGHGAYRVLKAIGKEKTEKLYFAVMTQALTERDTFTTAAAQTRAFCQQMYDESTCKKVDKALTETGL
ncbi:MAG: M4 family metallopeptidase [Oligoflexia bacterium]|nr:M4 family metallopeptidase [Oligoflexia bacterium]